MLLHPRANRADQEQNLRIFYFMARILKYACHDLSVRNKRQKSHFPQSNIEPSRVLKKGVEQAAF